MASPAPTLAALALALALPPAAARAADFSDYTGAELYHRFCAACHGAELHGDGPVSGSLRGAVPDLTLIAKRHGGEFPAAWVYRVVDGRERLLSHGPRDMPVWGEELWREQGADLTAGAKTRDVIERLVGFLRERQALRRPEDLGR
jgi:mono/diheme cytochrome c family protein